MQEEQEQQQEKYVAHRQCLFFFAPNILLGPKKIWKKEKSLNRPVKLFPPIFFGSYGIRGTTTIPDHKV